MLAVLKTCKGDRGFSLIELLFAVVILTVISMAAFAVINTGSRTASTNDQTVQIQQNTRVALDLISRDIRMAGYGNPLNPGLVPGPGSAGCPALINPVNGVNAPDQISIVAVNQVIGTLAAAPAVPGGSITISPATAATTLQNGDVITLEGVFTATVTNPNPVANPVTLNTTFQAPQQFGTTTGVVQLQCVTYAVSAANQLVRNGVPVADGIIDLQLAYGVDTNGDGRIDDTTLDGTVDCLDFIPNTLAVVAGKTNSVGCGGTGAVGTPPGAFPSPPTSSIRLVRISVVGQALRADQTFTGGTALTVEDRSILANPGFRRRVLTRTINLREIS